MDKLTRYRETVQRLIREYAGFKPLNRQIKTEAVLDTDHDHYEVMHFGWDRGLRVHASIIHVDIHDGKIWIEYDGTNRPIAEEMVEAGIPKEDIVLAFHPAEIRKHTGYGVG
jgi:XisI protein